ncbi:hypothetical protein [Glaciibacter psychrotolerans]|uniref:Tight adherence protein B n=1 Tax=Glaciibacter psychrotolerans TaxID=670054 RepID=A0A7Z0EFR0_9MICO|nr:tight adherence protein B [Leifsonia psychrotolerans]
MSALEEVAQVAERVAVLLSAGVSPARAWGYLLPVDHVGGHQAVGESNEGERDAGNPGIGEPGVGEFAVGELDLRMPSSRIPGRPHRQRPSAQAEARTERIIRAAAFAGLRGESAADAIAFEARSRDNREREAWLCLAAAWSVATEAGAPLAGCLRDLAQAFRHIGQLHRDLDVAVAGPAATARMVMVLPIIGILFGTVMGFDTLRTLFLTVPGVLCLGVGALLLVLAARWNRRLLRSARAQSVAPGLELDLTAIALAGGGSIDGARALVAVAQRRFLSGNDEPPSTATTTTDAVAVARSGTGSRIESDSEPGSESDGLRDSVLDLAERAGVPAAELLRSEAEQLRRQARSEGQQRAEALAVTLMIPLGVCVLPAFMLVGVMPLLLGVLSSTLSTL